MFALRSCALIGTILLPLLINSAGSAIGDSSAASQQNRSGWKSRKPNPTGKVFILEYHHVQEEESRWGRSSANFRKDLEALYNRGYRPITLSEYISGDFKIPSRATPVVFTFDDGHLNQFRYLPNGQIDPKCAVGVWAEFAKTRPDFPVKATWFVLPPVPFGQKNLGKKKIDFLQKQGSEIGIHTMSHRSLAKLTDAEVKKEIGESIRWLRKYGVNARTMAMPYGEFPKNKVLLKEFIYDRERFKLDGAVRVGAIPAPAPGSKEMKRFALPRIQGVDLPEGLTTWLGRADRKRVSLYVEP